jgi:ATP-binding cassette subfamily B protein
VTLVGGYNAIVVIPVFADTSIWLHTQEPKLFGTSIRENIQYGNPEATLEEIEKAAKAANAHEFIESFPDSYNTQVGDMGGKLSGGQKVLACHVVLWLCARSIVVSQMFALCSVCP